MSDFGDWDPDDSLDHEPADPEQVARFLHKLRRDEGLDDGFEWDELTPAQRSLLVLIMSRVLEWMRRQGAF